MMKRVIASGLAGVMLFASVAYAADYWTEQNENIQTGIGQEDTQQEVEKVTIDELINNGWSQEYAPIEEEETVYISPFLNEMKLLVSLEMLSVDESGDLKPRENLSYYDFTKTTVTLADASNVDISVLENVPNVVTKELLAETMVTILGYDKLEMTENPDYSAIAAKYGIFKGVSIGNNTAVTREQFAKVVSNVLEKEMVTSTIDGSVKYEISSETTPLSQMDIYKIRGWVNADENTNIYSQNPTSEGRVLIDNEEYSVGTSNAGEYLGRYVDAYIRDDDDKTILCITVNEAKDNYISVNDVDIELLSKEGLEYLTYDEEGNVLSRNKTIKLNKDTGVVYNGKFSGALGALNNTFLTNINGNVAAIDTDFNNVYDVLFIWSFDTYFIDQVSSGKVVNASDGKILDLADDTKDIKIYLDGQLTDVSKLSATNVLSVAMSEDKSMYTVYVSYKSISGAVQTQNDEYIVLNDGKEYRKDIDFSDKIEFGKDYMFYFTHNNKIAAVKLFSASHTDTRTGRNYGYLRKCFFDDEDPDAASFRIFKLSDQTWVTLKGAKKMNFYSGAVAGEETEENEASEVVRKQRLTPSETARLLDESQLIVFETNAYGEVSSITKAVDYTKTGEKNDDVFAFNRRFEKESEKDADLKFRTYYGGFFAGYYHRGKSIMLRVPNDRSQEELYGIESVDADGAVIGNIDVYDVSEGLVLSGVIIRYAAGGTNIKNAGDAQFIVESVTQQYINDRNVIEVTALGGKKYYIRDEGEIGEASVVTVNNADGTNKVPMCHVKTGAEIKKGDMICCNVDSLGYITKFRVDVRIGDIRTDTPYFAYNSGGEVAPLYYDYGLVLENTPSDSVCVLNTTQPVDRTKDVPKLLKGLLYSYDTKTGKFEQLSGAADILPGDKLVVFSKYYLMNVHAVVIK